MRTLALSLILLAACGPTPASVQLEVAFDEDVVDVGAIKVIVQPLDDDTQPQVFGPFDLGALNAVENFVVVEFGAQFYVDVWACPDFANCAGADRVGRGCSEAISVTEGQNGFVRVQVRNDVAGTAECDALTAE